MLCLSLAAEVVKSDVFGRHAEVVEHFHNSGEHHGRSAEVVFNFFRLGVVFQIVIQQNLVDEAGVAGPVVFRKRF